MYKQLLMISLLVSGSVFCDGETEDKGEQAVKTQVKWVRRTTASANPEIVFDTDVPNDPSEFRDASKVLMTYEEDESIQGVAVRVKLVAKSEKYAKTDIEIDVVAGKNWQKFFKNNDKLSDQSLEMIRVLALKEIEDSKKDLQEKEEFKHKRATLLFERATSAVFGGGLVFVAMLINSKL